MVVVGVLVADADDAEPFVSSDRVPLYGPRLNFDFDLHIDVRPREVIENLSGCLPSKEWRARAIPVIQP